MEEKIKLTLPAILKLRGETIAEFSRGSGIPYHHLRMLSCSKVEMTAKDLWAIVEYTGIPIEQIQI